MNEVRMKVIVIPILEADTYISIYKDKKEVQLFSMQLRDGHHSSMGPPPWIPPMNPACIEYVYV